MLNVVFIPGLGADERLFELLNLSDCKCHYIRWTKPVADIGINEYLELLVQQLPAFESPPVLVGVSLGGIMAMEWRELYPVQKTILISSVKDRTEVPGYFSIFEKFRIHKAVHPSLLKKGNVLVKPFISDTSNKKALELFNAMLHDANEDFIKWGLNAVMTWKKGKSDISELIHIHGNADHIFPLRYISKPDYVIEDGRHDMVLSKADEISKILMKEFSKIETNKKGYKTN